MPNRHTFLIPPIKELVYKYGGDFKGWIDPFAGENSPADITNDLNPMKPTKYHLKADDFLSQLTGEFNGALFDPPYSLRQLKECYGDIGVKLMQDETNYFPTKERRLCGKLIKMGGVSISCGWNSQGMGKEAGFEIIEILLVAHGRSHNDTIITVERKFTSEIF